jgi:putative holliday junction resolvase
MSGRILAVDPGEKRLGIAITDPTGTIARSLCVVNHVSNIVDGASIAALAKEQEAILIVVGQALGPEGQSTPQSRHSQKLADSIRSQSEIPIVLWDESGSTQTARQTRVAMGAKRADRNGHLDDLAAVIILQSYLENTNEQT